MTCTETIHATVEHRVPEPILLEETNDTCLVPIRAPMGPVDGDCGSDACAMFDDLLKVLS